MSGGWRKRASCWGRVGAGGEALADREAIAVGLERLVREFEVVGVGAADDAFNTSTFTILNTELRYVAHQEQLTSQVQYVVSEWDDLFVFTIDGKVNIFCNSS